VLPKCRFIGRPTNASQIACTAVARGESAQRIARHRQGAVGFDPDRSRARALQLLIGEVVEISTRLDHVVSVANGAVVAFEPRLKMNHTVVVHVEVPACSHGVASRSRPRRAAHDLANRLLDPLIQNKTAPAENIFTPAFAKAYGGADPKVLMMPGPTWYAKDVFSGTLKIPAGHMAAAMPLKWNDESPITTGQKRSVPFSTPSSRMTVHSSGIGFTFSRRR